MRIPGKHAKNFACATLAIAALGIALVPDGFAQDASQQSGARASPEADVVARVKQALQSNSTLDSRHIDVSVEHGDVVLSGFVQDNRSLLVAQQDATKAAGNRKIVNRIIIKENFPNAP